MIREHCRSPSAVRCARYRQTQWEGVLNAGEAPNDWMIWLAHMRSVERDRNTGTSGFVDDEFYRSVNRFMDRHGAPVEVRNVLACYRALAAWDFAEASRTADALVLPTVNGQQWIAPDELLDGGVLAKLRLGDLEGATQFYDLLAPKRRRDSEDLRSRLVEAYLGASLNGNRD